MKTITVNRFDKFFGPVGSAAGLFLLLAGIGLAFIELSALLLVPCGLFFAYTHCSTTIDFQNKKVRFSNNLVGVFKFGKWIDINSEMYIDIHRNNKVYRTYSRGNRALDIKTHQFEVVLYNRENKRILPLMFSKNLEHAKEATKEIAIRLELDLKNKNI